MYKKLISIITAVMLVLALPTFAFAANGTVEPSSKPGNNEPPAQNTDTNTNTNTEAPGNATDTATDAAIPAKVTTTTDDNGNTVVVAKTDSGKEILTAIIPGSAGEVNVSTYANGITAAEQANPALKPGTETGSVFEDLKASGDIKGVYTFSVTADGYKYNPEKGSITITYVLPKSEAGNTAYLFVSHPDGREAQWLTAEVNPDGSVTFEGIDGLSMFTIVTAANPTEPEPADQPTGSDTDKETQANADTAKKKAKDTSSKSPQTGTDYSMLTLGAVCLVGAAAVVTVVLRKKMAK